MSNTRDAYFENMYNQSYQQVHIFARRLCGNYDQAEDLTQETFVRAYNSTGLSTSGGNVDSWLKRIVYNLFLDSKRRDSRRIREVSETTLDENGMDQFSDSRMSAEETLTSEMPNPVLARAIDSLDTEGQELLRLAFVERMPHQQIAQRLGIKTGTARSRIHRLCLQLRHAEERLVATKRST